MKDPRGGVRHVMPSKANYESKPSKGNVWVEPYRHLQDIWQLLSPILPHMPLLEQANWASLAGLFSAYMDG